MFLLKAPSPTFLGTLQTVARVATENWKLQVKWNNSRQSFTDCRTEIQLGWSTDWIMEGCSNLAEWTAAMKGVLEHEIAHNLFSRNYEVRDSEVVPLLVMESYYKKLHEEGMPKNISKFIQNALEDGRVNRLHVNMSPKMVQTLRWIVQLIYKDACRAMVEIKSPLAWALNSLLGRILVGKDLEGVPEETVRFLDSIQGYIEEGLRAESCSVMISKAGLPIAEAFIDEFPSMFVPAHLVPNLEHGKHRPVEDLDKRKRVPDQGVDVRVIPKRLPEPETKEDVAQPKVTNDSASSSEDTTVKVGETKEDPSDSVPSSEELHEESKLTEEATETEDEFVPKDVDEDSGVGGIGEPETDDTGREVDIKSDWLDVAGTEEGEQSEEFKSDDLSDEAEESGEVDESYNDEERGDIPDEADLAVEDDSSELTDDENATWVDGVPEVSDGAIDLEHGADYSTCTSEEDGSPKVESNITSDERSCEEDSIVEEPTEEDAEEALAKLSDWDEFSETGEEVDFTELFSKSAEESNEFSAKDEAVERELRADREEVSHFEVGDVRKFSVGHHARVRFKEVQAPDRAEWVGLFDRASDEVSTLIDEASDALYEYLVRQNRSAQRNLRSGRIDPRRLWRASGLLDGRIFMEREAPSNTKDVAFYLLLDMSGSMGDGNKVENARKAAIILAVMLETFGVAHTIVAFTGDMNGSESVEHYRLVNWGEAEKHRLMFYHAADNNRDGYSLRIASDELSKRPERAKILLMLSDGEPHADRYEVRSGFDRKDPVLNDVASAIEEATEKKVDVLHLYFGETKKETLEKVAFMYPKLSVITNPVDVPGAVADIVVSTLRKYM